MDPLELRNYEEEDFMQPSAQPMLPPQPGQDILEKPTRTERIWMSLTNQSEKRSITWL